jgi:hypothetical protein
MRNALAFFVTALATTQTFAQDRDAYEGISVNIYGFSKHMNPNTQNPYHSTHPGIGIQKHFGTCFWGTANCFAGIDYIHRNSVGGKVWKVEVGSKWTLLTTSEGYHFHVEEPWSTLTTKIQGRIPPTLDLLQSPSLV